MKRQNRVAIYNISSKILLKGISIFSAPIFARLLSDAGYGIVSLYTVWVSIASIAFCGQTQGTLINAKIEYSEEEQSRYQSSVMGLSLVWFLVCGGLVLLFLGPVSALLKLDEWIVVMILIQALGTYCVNFLHCKYTNEFQARKNMLLSVGIALSTLIVSLVFVLLFPKEINHYGRILGIGATYGGAGLITCLVILLRGRTFYHRQYWKFCLMLCLPMVFQNLSDLILGQCDRLMLQHMMNEAMVGQYSLAYNFGGILFTIFGALNGTWVPFFFDDMKYGREEALRAQAKNFLELFTVLSVGFVLLTKEVYYLFAGPTFREGTMLVPIFASSYFLNFLCTFPVNFEYFHKKTKPVAIITVSASVLNLVLNYILIRAIGVAGAALATAISHGIQLLMHHVYSSVFLGKGSYPFPVSFWGKYFAVYFLMVAAVYATDGMPLLRWSVGACIGLWELWRIKKRGVLL